MRHYEIVLLIHPDQSEQAPAMVQRYAEIVAEQGGVVHHVEDWGRIQTAYPVVDVHKCHYFLLNVTCHQSSVDELARKFRFNDVVLRNLILQTHAPMSEASPMLKLKEDDMGYDAGGMPSGNAFKRARRTPKDQRPDAIFNYKDVNYVKRFLTEVGRIVPRRLSRVSAPEQRALAKAVKIDRYLALLPYCDYHR